MNIKGLLGKSALLAGIAVGGLSLGAGVEASELTHTVEKGETLNEIATSYKVELNDLKVWNDISNINVINTGQELVLDGDKVSDKKETATEGNGTYTVKKGDTLFEIAVDNDITLNELKVWNNLTSDLIIVGQELVLDGSNVSAVEQVSVEQNGQNNEVNNEVNNTQTQTQTQTSSVAPKVVEYEEVEEVEQTEQVQAPVQKAQPKTQQASSTAPTSNSGLNWGALANCESGGRANVVSSNGMYHGLYQFDAQTWQSVGGSGVASDASAAEQTQRAQKLYDSRGSQPWPVCGANL